MQSFIKTMGISFLLIFLSACSSQPLSPEDELAMMLYRDCMANSPQQWTAEDATSALNRSGTQSPASLGADAQTHRDDRNHRDCMELSKERTSD